jgi:hypothetical protein
LKAFPPPMPMLSPGGGTMKVLPDGSNALFAPAAMLPASLLRPPSPTPVVVLLPVLIPVFLAPTPPTPAA